MLGTMNLYTIYDKVALHSGFVFEETNDETAIRAVKKQIVGGLEDYELFRLGNIDHGHMSLDVYDPVKIELYKGGNN